MKVKICGITDKETALLTVKLGADAIGFVFAESKRRINKKATKEIIESLPTHVMKVGVFVNETKEKIEEIVSYTGITHVQLHGDETAEFGTSLKVPVIKAFSVKTEQDIESAKNFPCEYLLFDSPGGKYRGGNGTTFDWTLSDSFPSNKRCILAGGLTAENVGKAIHISKPYMVDVSSGVETQGKKDIEKIRAFIHNAKTANLEEKHEHIYTT